LAKKIVILGPAFPLRGGIANFNNALAQAFHNRGDKVIVYSFSLQYPGFLFPGTSQFEKGKKPTNLNVNTIINSVNPFNWIRIVKKINKENPDYVIIRYWIPFLAPCLGTIAYFLNKKIKILAITDNIYPHEKRIGDSFLTKYFLNSCNAFITLSSSVLNDLSCFIDTKLKKFLPHPIYDIFGMKISKKEARNKLSLNLDDRYLLFFGFVRDYKGLDLILTAISDSRVRSLGVKLIIAGEFYNNKKKYIDLINELNINDYVIMNDNFISNEDVKYYFCAADMITQTYHSATQSGVTQIAYSLERPMLVTNVGGLAEIVPDRKVGYVTSKNPTNIADAIIDFYSNKMEDSFVLNIKQEKKRFSWDSFLRGIDELMNLVKK
tara:strand:- start:21 stop:1157 length:1137 start_codon:yes stop_codon:yes gene_type:complete